jgi:hypothetical protein
MDSRVEIELVQDDILNVKADVVALKYAQCHYGADRLIADKLMEAGVQEASMRPKVGEWELIESRDAITAKSVLFIGVVGLDLFQYREIREFARRVLSSLALSDPETRHVAVTIHGANYGLDEIESFEAEIAGFVDAISAGDIPRRLKKITIVERNSGRVTYLLPVLDELYSSVPVHPFPGSSREASVERLRAAGYASESKSHVFVAMPFKSEMDDTYHYGIQSAVRDAGFLCERADLSAYVGDVMHWVQNRIQTSSLVIADLTGANPNVYLEVGFAWGCGIPVVLIVRESDDLKFDVQGQRCLSYGNIRELETALRSELEGLRAVGTA